MDKRSSKKRDHDFSVTAFSVVQRATGEVEDTQVQPEPTAEERHNAAVMLGRKGGLKGGKARASKLTPEQRQAISKKAAAARWGKEPTS